MNSEKVREGFANPENVDPPQNVTRFTPPPLKPAAKRIVDRVQFAGDYTAKLERDYVAKGWIDRGAVSVVYGAANVGKSFWAIDLAKHVHQGKEWAGNRVRQGAALYVALEGGAPFFNRLVAAQAGFMVLPGPLRLGGQGSDAQPLAEAVRHLADVHGPFSLIVVDTLARAMAGDENAAADIARLVNDLDHLRRFTGAHVMLIHHSGKDQARGARGHSALRAAVDTEIELTRDDDGERCATITKQCDGESGRRHRFTLETVSLGRDSDGDEVTTCIINHEEERRML